MDGWTGEVEGNGCDRAGGGEKEEGRPVAAGGVEDGGCEQRGGAADGDVGDLREAGKPAHYVGHTPFHLVRI